MNRAAAIAARLLEDGEAARDWMLDQNPLEIALDHHGFRRIDDEAGPDRRPKYLFFDHEAGFRVYVTLEDDNAIVKVTSRNDPKGESMLVFSSHAAAFIHALMPALRSGASPYTAIVRAATHSVAV